MKTTGHGLPGEEPTNICNSGRRKAGAQLELPRTLRDELVVDASLRQTFAAAVRGAIERRVAGVDDGSSPEEPHPLAAKAAVEPEIVRK